jgi:hypothetical protein
VCTALQAVASPLGHSTAGVDAYRTFERMTGFEPATPTLARLCATNCATSACYVRDRRALRCSTIVHLSRQTQIPCSATGKCVVSGCTPTRATGSWASRKLVSWHWCVRRSPAPSSTERTADAHAAVRRTAPRRAGRCRRRGRGETSGASGPMDETGASSGSRPRQTAGSPESSDRPILVSHGDRASVRRRSTPGLVAQWESVRLTRGRSLVRYQPGPPQKSQMRSGFFGTATGGGSPRSTRGRNVLPSNASTVAPRRLRKRLPTRAHQPPATPSRCIRPRASPARRQRPSIRSATRRRASHVSRR